MWRLLKGIGKLFSNILALGGYRADKAADGVFAGSAEGIKAAHDMTAEEIRNNAGAMFESVSSLKAGLNRDVASVETLKEEQEELVGSRDGALDELIDLGEKGDPKRKADIEADLASFDKRLQEIEAELAELRANIGRDSAEVETLLKRYSDMLERARQLERDGDRAAARFLADKERLRAYENLQTGEGSVNMDRVKAAQEASQQLAAKVQLAAQVDGADVRNRAAGYRVRASQTASSERTQQLLAARMKERGMKVPGEKAAEVKKPTI